MANILIIIFASLSYLIGFWAILKREYKPNLFTRIVWLGIAINNVVSVIAIQNQTPTIVLAWVTFSGSALIFIGSIFYGERVFQKKEITSAILLFISFLIWVFTDIPLLNLSIGLIAHLLGSIPTVVRVIKNPEEENVPFWGFFAIASIIAIFVTPLGDVKDYLFITYFCVFDTGMALLSMRQYFKRVSK